jgi:hypothetical protein
VRCCILCGRTDNITQHHLGGKNFIGWFTIALCERCHKIFHARQRAAGIDLRSTPNPRIRLLRALKMTLLFMWMLVDMLEREIDQDIDKCPRLRGRSPRRRN